MLKKEIQEQIKKFDKNIIENQEHLKVLDTFETKNKTQNSLLFSQENIKKNVNLYTSEKSFNLFLENGPFFTNYSRNGSHLLVYNDSGYISSFNTQSLNLKYEININDKINDAKFLHNHEFTAVAQSDCIFVYDGVGSELHAVRKIISPKKIEFLSYHFLLACACGNGKLRYLDTSIGEIVSDIFIGDKNVTSIKSNPSNGVIYLGSNTGSVTLWSPAQNSLLMKVQCNKSTISNIEIDRSGNKMITTGIDKKINIFDIRNSYAPLKTINVKTGMDTSALSQMNMLAISNGNKLIILKNFEEEIYLKHRVSSNIYSMNFCNYEDILTIGHENGISNIIVPGSGDPIYDSNECSPFMTNKQRKELEVKQLLDKIPHDLIAHESIIGGISKPSKITNPQVESLRYFEEEDKNALSRFKKKE